MFKLENLSMKDTVELQLRHPVSDELLFADEDKSAPVAIVLYGTSSKQYRNAITAMQNRSLKRGKKQVSAEVMREEGVELLVACSEKALNLSYKDAPVDHDDAFRELYSDPTFSWLKDQVDTALGDISNFLNQ
jgi:hypothetical protein